MSRLKSEVWLYFIDGANGDPTKGLCKLCGTIVSRGRYINGLTTTNMWDHLMRLHPEQYNSCDKKAAPNRAKYMQLPKYGLLQNQKVICHEQTTSIIRRKRGRPVKPRTSHLLASISRSAASEGHRYQSQARSKKAAAGDPEESDLKYAGKAFLGVLFGPDNYRRWLEVKRRSNHTDNRSFVNWLLNVALSSFHRSGEVPSAADVVGLDHSHEQGEDVKDEEEEVVLYPPCTVTASGDDDDDGGGGVICLDMDEPNTEEHIDGTDIDYKDGEMDFSQHTTHRTKSPSHITSQPHNNSQPQRNPPRRSLSPLPRRSSSPLPRRSSSPLPRRYFAKKTNRRLPSTSDSSAMMKLESSAIASDRGRGGEWDGPETVNSHIKIKRFKPYQYKSQNGIMVKQEEDSG